MAADISRTVGAVREHSLETVALARSVLEGNLDRAVRLIDQIIDMKPQDRAIHIISEVLRDPGTDFLGDYARHIFLQNVEKIKTDLPLSILQVLQQPSDHREQAVGTAGMSEPSNNVEQAVGTAGMLEE